MIVELEEVDGADLVMITVRDTESGVVRIVGSITVLGVLVTVVCLVTVVVVGITAVGSMVVPGTYVVGMITDDCGIT